MKAILALSGTLLNNVFACFFSNATLAFDECSQQDLGNAFRFLRSHAKNEQSFYHTGLLPPDVAVQFQQHHFVRAAESLLRVGQEQFCTKVNHLISTGRLPKLGDTYYDGVTRPDGFLSTPTFVDASFLSLAADVLGPELEGRKRAALVSMCQQAVEDKARLSVRLRAFKQGKSTGPVHRLGKDLWKLVEDAGEGISTGVVVSEVLQLYDEIFTATSHIGEISCSVIEDLVNDGASGTMFRLAGKLCDVDEEAVERITKAKSLLLKYGSEAARLVEQDLAHVIDAALLSEVMEITGVVAVTV